MPSPELGRNMDGSKAGLRVLHLSTFDLRGGAAQAAYRLHRGLLNLGLDSHMGVQFPQSDEWRVHGPVGKVDKAAALLRDVLDPLPRRFYRRPNTTDWSLNWVPHRLASNVKALAPDIVHLHWVNAGFVPIRALKTLPYPLVWTMHDMWPFTGGCHHAAECTGFQHGCGNCPQLGSRHHNDLSRMLLSMKRRNWCNVAIQLVAPSHWLAKKAENSLLFSDCDIEVIPNGLDLSVYQPRDKTQARDLLGLPRTSRLLLFVAARGLLTSYKGGELLEAVLNSVITEHKDVELVVLGSSKPETDVLSSLPVSYLGRFSDEVSRALVYAAADILVSTSLEDNLPNTVMEALSCGIPVAAFATGGIPEMIAHKECGYLVEKGDITALAQGITWLLEHPQPDQLAQKARVEAEAFDIRTTVAAYRQLYGSLLSEGGNER